MINSKFIAENLNLANTLKCQFYSIKGVLDTAVNHLRVWFDEYTENIKLYSLNGFFPQDYRKLEEIFLYVAIKLLTTMLEQN